VPNVVEALPDDDAAQLAEAARLGAEPWSHFGLGVEGFEAYLASHIDDEVADESDWHGKLQLCDLYLCWACLQHCEAAIREFDNNYVAPCVAELARVLGSRGAADELIQQMRVELVVGAPTRAPLLSRYSGKGALRKWLRVVLQRAALKVKNVEARCRPVGDAGVFDHLTTGQDDAELDRVKQLYQPAFERAVERAFEQLSADQRNLLRMYVIDHMTMRQLGAVHKVSEATVSRWLARIREGLWWATREQLAAELDVRSSEWRSMVAALRDHVHVSIERLLR